MEKTKKQTLPAALLTVLSAPLLIMAVILYAYKLDGAFPFGKGTVAWGDMIQQVVPLLIDLKDMLAGKDGVFLNFNNAAGMNMWAVIFFFLASPFSFLVVFIKKTDMLYFANILIMLKLMVCGGTASLYLYKTRKKLYPVWITALGTLYGLCGYGLLYYQNVIWLDMMYLFPLMLLTLEMLCEKKRVLPYTIVLAAMMVVNYYIGYMVVIFIMLFIGLALCAVRRESSGGETAVRFAAGSVMAALLTAVVWLPSLLQYAKSGRVKEEFFSSIRSTGFLTSYETVLPTVLCSAFVLAAVLFFSCDGKPRSRKLNNYLVLAFLTLIPIIVEPINLMWHTGSYMSFPSRFGFITVFMLTVCTAMYLEDRDTLIKENKLTDHAAILIPVLAVTYLFIDLVTDYIEKHRESASKYVGSLWGDKGSLQICVTMFLLMSAMSAVMLLLYRKGILSTRTLSIICTALILCESFSNVRIYLTTPAVNYPERAADQNKVYDLADRIDDSDMFRVKTDGKLFYVNLVGTLGYGSISHYTSLNSQDYMFMMKRFGVSSNWMDVGSYGGTELTDMLMSIKYQIVRGEAENAVYTNGDYSITENSAYLPSGVIIGDISAIEGDLPDMSRCEIQQFICDNVLTEDAVKTYTFEGTENGSGYTVSNGDTCELTLDINGRQSVYFDAFDQPQVSLGSPIDGSFDILVNGNMIKSNYPSGDFNGMQKLGEFENETITITANVKKDIDLHSLGVTAIDTDKLRAAAEAAQTVGFTRKCGKLTGTINASAGQYCLINVPYTDGLKVHINGKSVPCIRVLGDLTAVELTDGENNITVTAMPKGFISGVFLSIGGAGLCILWHFVISKKLKVSEKASKALMWTVMAASAAVFAAVYIMPVIVHLTAEEN
ncbi:MAG: YfhO family protein [Ruminococcus sp.]|uniref:YfhO family protein n=1 Tax=Ruminococcus sp. TaxID=41978 RepID=UPI0025E42347|nr:YfhO family protein [Ruminococcus sp.]MCR5539665.1 YfhO family protein [Ruminococcus sp.]